MESGKNLFSEQTPEFLPELDNPALYDYNPNPLEAMSGMTFLGRLPWKKSIDIPESPLGIGFETLDRNTFDPRAVIPFLAFSGVKHARCQTGWMRCEKVPGQYDFAWLDEVVDGLLAIGIQPWFSLGFGNPLYTPCEKYEKMWAEAAGKMVPGFARGYVGEIPIYHGEKAMAAWKRYVEALSVHFKGRVFEYEVWNEPEYVMMHKGEDMLPKLGVKQCARDYVEFVRFCAETVRGIIPDAKIIAILARLSSPFVVEAGRNGLGQIADIISYHSYENAPEKQALEQFEHLRANLEIPGKKLALWQGESGRASGKNALFSMPTQYNQAKYLVRRYLTDFLCGAEQSSFFTVTDFKCYYPDGRDQFYGVIDARENKPKLAFHAMQSMGWFFDGLERAPDLIALFDQPVQPFFSSILPYRVTSGAFRRKGIPVFALWIPENVDISARSVPGEIRITIGEGEILKDPVVIDPVRRTVYRFSGWRPEPLFASQIFENFVLHDYPLLITDISVFDQ